MIASTKIRNIKFHSSSKQQIYKSSLYHMNPWQEQLPFLFSSLQSLASHRDRHYYHFLTNLHMKKRKKNLQQERGYTLLYVRFDEPTKEPKEPKECTLLLRRAKQMAINASGLGDQLLVPDRHRRRRREHGAGDPRPPILLQPLDAGQLPHDLRLLPAARHPGERVKRPEVVAGLVVAEDGALGAVRRQVAQRLQRVRRVEERPQRARHHVPRRPLGSPVRVQPEQSRPLRQERVRRRRRAVRLQDVRRAHRRVQHPLLTHNATGVRRPQQR